MCQNLVDKMTNHPHVRHFGKQALFQGFRGTPSCRDERTVKICRDIEIIFLNQYVEKHAETTNAKP